MVINNDEKIKGLKESGYQSLFGVKKEVFDKMLFVLERAQAELHMRGGKPPTLSVLDKLIITLDYYKDYRPMHRIGFDYGVTKNAISKAILWVECELLKDERYHLPSKKTLREADYEIILVDATECAIEKPKKNRKNGIPERKNDIR